MNDEPKTMNDERRTPNGSDMPDDIALSVRNVSKKFCRNLKRSMHYGTKDLACNLVGVRQDTSKIRRDEFWALKDVSFDLKRGESLGIIGVNGCGKSTLFRVIHGIYPPDAGDIRMRGRAGALIALGAGFHPHMTGRENIFLNGTILGIPVAEIRERLDEIIEFSELKEFIDAPVSTYSSGMYVRLGFSVAVHMNPDILLIDEVLAVGDVSFQNKCMKYLRKLLGEGRTILFVSHNMSSVARICSRVILLDRGKIIADGDPSEAICVYYSRSSEAESLNASGQASDCVPIRTYSTDLASIVSLSTVANNDGSNAVPLYRSEVEFVAQFDVYKKISGLKMELIFYAPNMGVIAARTDVARYSQALDKGSYAAKIRCKGMNLAPGTYWIHPTLFDADTVLSKVDNACSLTIVGKGDSLPHNRAGFYEIDVDLSVEASENCSVGV
jgi:lipopolysaccharide transport system ATP-binding protein